MSSLPLLRIHTDGASRGNPGAAAFGYVIETDDGERIEEGDCLGDLTNNQAEYTALVRALEHALQLGAEHQLEVFSDSELMVKQINGIYRVKNQDLRPLYQQACALLDQFSKTTVCHVRREENGRADELCNEALDGKRKATVRSSGDELREEALLCLSAAAETWSAVGLEQLRPEEVWRQLCKLLSKHGVTKQPL